MYGDPSLPMDKVNQKINVIVHSNIYVKNLKIKRMGNKNKYFM